MIRTIAIWVTGLLTSAMWGGLLANYLNPGSYGVAGGGIVGVVAGPLTFVCFRLWLKERRDSA